MSAQQSATLPGCEGKARRESKVDVITIRIFRRPDSRYWQALVRCGKFKKRITTKTTLKSAAGEFAELAFRHFSRMKDRNAPPPVNPEAQQEITYADQ